MKLTPHQILQKLGFDVPAEGVEINPNDAYLHDTVLRLAGQSISLANVPDAEIAGLHAGMAGLVAAWRNEPAQATTPHTVARTRTMANAVLALTFKHSVTAKPAA